MGWAMAVNIAPVAVNDFLDVDESASIVLNGNLLANDVDPDAGDTKTLVSVNPTAATHGQITVQSGVYSYAAGAFYESLAQDEVATDTFTYTMKDSAGATSTATVTMTVHGVNDAPVAVNDSANVLANGVVSVNVLANDTDVDMGDQKAIVSFTQGASGATVTFEGNQLVYHADADSFGGLNSSQTVTDTFTYTMTDAAHATSTATVTVTVRGQPNGPDIYGTNRSEVINGTNASERIFAQNGNDTLNGFDGADKLYAGNGSDLLLGGGGPDQLFGSSGRDTLDGGTGADTLVGMGGNDVFVYGQNGSKDVILDFQPGHFECWTDYDRHHHKQTHQEWEGGDVIKIDPIVSGSFADVMAHATQTWYGVVINFDGANSLTLVGVTLNNLHVDDFLFSA
ncbi:MAG: Ig-like domain-containing protein [Phenylobacterium sp.]